MGFTNKHNIYRVSESGYIPIYKHPKFIIFSIQFFKYRYSYNVLIFIKTLGGVSRFRVIHNLSNNEDGKQI